MTGDARRYPRRNDLIHHEREPMRVHPSRPRLGLVPTVGLVAVLAIMAAACGSSSKSASSAASQSTTASGGLAAAKLAIAPYTGHPSAFPVNTKLDKRPPAGSKFVFLQCAAPFCAQLAELLVAPTKAMNVKLSVINSGLTAASSQAAAAAALAQKPAAVLISAVSPALFGGALKELRAAGVAVVGVGIVNGKPYGVQESVGGADSDVTAGRLMADWVAVHKGANANVAFFGTTGLDFSPLMQTGFKSELASACPTCRYDAQQLSVLTFGTTAPSAVIAYLQAHPQVNTVVFATMEAATGLAAALKDADMHVTTMGFAPSTSNLQDIRNGGLTAALAVDQPVEAWVQVDITARLLTHQTVTPSETNVDLQFLTQSDVTVADTQNGWTGYPDVADRFAKLWPPAS
jgi:ribose transport system substrate-binding protein